MAVEEFPSMKVDNGDIWRFLNAADLVAAVQGPAVVIIDDDEGDDVRTPETAVVDVYDDETPPSPSSSPTADLLPQASTSFWPLPSSAFLGWPLKNMKVRPQSNKQKTKD